MTKEELRELQLKELILLDKIESLSKKLGLTYYIIAGTLLGAVRNKGFVPWDDDLDIAMPRDDYNKLRDYFYRNEDDEFFYEDQNTDKHHYCIHALIKIKNTVFLHKRLSNADKHLKCKGVYLDIFPLDKAPTSNELAEQQANKIKKIRKLFYYKEAQIYENDSFLKKLFKKIRKLLFVPISFKRLSNKLIKEETKYNNGDGQYLVSMSSHYSYKKQMIRKDIYGDPQYVSFEGKQYKAPQQIEEYLTHLYGNYLELPPEEKRYLGLNDLIFIDNRV